VPSRRAFYGEKGRRELNAPSSTLIVDLL